MGDGPHSAVMHIHGSCAARDGAGVLLVGPPGSGKSDLLLRLLDRGFKLVADDQVEIVDGCARPHPALAGLIEVRGLGIVRLPYLPMVRLALVAVLGAPGQRLPMPARHAELGLPSIQLDATTPSAAARLALALECAINHVEQHTGAFTDPGAFAA